MLPVTSVRQHLAQCDKEIAPSNICVAQVHNLTNILYNIALRLCIFTERPCMTYSTYFKFMRTVCLMHVIKKQMFWYKYLNYKHLYAMFLYTVLLYFVKRQKVVLLWCQMKTVVNQTVCIVYHNLLTAVHIVKVNLWVFQLVTKYFHKSISMVRYYLMNVVNPFFYHLTESLFKAVQSGVGIWYTFF